MSTFFLALFLALFTGLMIVFASLAMGGHLQSAHFRCCDRYFGR